VVITIRTNIVDAIAGDADTWFPAFDGIRALAIGLDAGGTRVLDLGGGEGGVSTRPVGSHARSPVILLFFNRK
jgi:hypothetical protein